MPNLDLMEVFNSEFPVSPIALEQMSYYFEQSPEVYFINEHDEIVTDYNLLPSVVLTEEEANLLEQATQPELNEPQILVKGAKFVGSKIYMQAYKCDYKFLQAYASGKIFSPESPIYKLTFFKTGSIAALVTNDDKTVIVERNDTLKLFSSFAGFLKTEISEGRNIAVDTAIEESHEEFFQFTTGIELKDAEIKTLSFRKGNITGKFGTLEFIVKIGVDCSAEELEVALNEHLTDAKKPDGTPDHTGRYKIIDPKNILEKDFEIAEIDPVKKIIDPVKKIRDVSFFLTDPVVASVCNSLNVEVPSFMHRKSLNEVIFERQNTESQSQLQPQGEGWRAYLERRKLETSSGKVNEL